MRTVFSAFWYTGESVSDALYLRRPIHVRTIISIRDVSAIPFVLPAAGDCHSEIHALYRRHNHLSLFIRCLFPKTPVFVAVA